MTNKTVIFQVFNNNRSYFHLEHRRPQERVMYASGFYNKYLSLVVPANDIYHFFIISKEQQSDWVILMKAYSLQQYVVKERQEIYNLNYPADGPRLSYYIFRFPVGTTFPVVDLTEYL